MIIKRKYIQSDYDRIIEFLRQEYLENKNENSWLAQRWEDMEYRVDVLHTQERNKPSWHDYIMIWEDDGKIVAVCNKEGGNECWMHIHNGYEYLYPEMLTWAENSIAKLGDSLSVFATESQPYKEKELLKRNYDKNTNLEEISFMKKVKCNKTYEVNVPEGFEIIAGTEGLNHKEIRNACEYGFHPDREGQLSNEGELAPSWKSRDIAPMFDYKFEVIAKAPNGETASYSYVWVDRKTSTGYIEPVSTRLKYRRLGLGKAIQLATLNLLNKENVEYCFVNPYGETRDKFYSSCGYVTFDKEFEYKKEL